MNRTGLKILYRMFIILAYVIACATVIIWLYPMRNYAPLPNWIPVAPDWLVTIGTFPHGKAYAVVVFVVGGVFVMLTIDAASAIYAKLQPDQKKMKHKPNKTGEQNAEKPTRA